MVELVTIGMQIASLILAVVLAVIAQYIAIKVFNRMTKGIDEFAEIKKGNVAVGVIMASVLISVSTIIAGGVAGIFIPTSSGELLKLGVSLFWLLIAIVIAVFAQFVALSVYSRLTEGINEQKELKKGNLAVAVTLAAVIIGVALVVQAGLPRF
jgi:uncharacterized membrane protein YjfL (UPF0719 family)